MISSWQTLSNWSNLNRCFKGFQKICLLLGKLVIFGFHQRLCTFLKSIFYNRFQYVDFNEFVSSELTPSSGVSQRSIVVPLLFNNFINDFVENLLSLCLIYADDLKLYAEVKNISDCLDHQSDLNIIHEWCLMNRLIINVSECKIVYYCLKEKENAVFFSKRDSPIWYLSRPWCNFLWKTSLGFHQLQLE